MRVRLGQLVTHRPPRLPDPWHDRRMERDLPATGRAVMGTEGAEGAAAVLLRRAQEIADQLQREAAEEAARATSEARHLREEAVRLHDDTLSEVERLRVEAERDRDLAARRLDDASGEARAIVTD